MDVSLVPYQAQLQPGFVLIGTASKQAYDPSSDLYDYAQTKAAIMRYFVAQSHLWKVVGRQFLRKLRSRIWGLRANATTARFLARHGHWQSIRERPVSNTRISR